MTRPAAFIPAALDSPSGTLDRNTAATATALTEPPAIMLTQSRSIPESRRVFGGARVYTLATLAVNRRGAPAPHSGLGPDRHRRWALHTRVRALT